MLTHGALFEWIAAPDDQTQTEVPYFSNSGNLTRIEITEKAVAKFENEVSCRFNSGLYPRASSVASSSASVSLARLARERNRVRNQGIAVLICWVEIDKSNPAGAWFKYLFGSPTGWSSPIESVSCLCWSFWGLKFLGAETFSESDEDDA